VEDIVRKARREVRLHLFTPRVRNERTPINNVFSFLSSFGGTCGEPTYIGDDLSGASRADMFLPKRKKKKKSRVGGLLGVVCPAGEGYERALEIG